MIKRFLAVCAVLCLSLAAHGATQPILQPYQTFLNPNAAGLPCAGCSLYSYAAGSTTAQPTYTDSTGLSQNTNPIILDTGGGAKIWLGANPYKFVLKDTLGTTIWTVDNVQPVVTLAGLQAYLPFTIVPPTSDLQTAITSAGANSDLTLVCGTYTVPAGLSISSAKVHLHGASRDCTFVNFTSSAGLDVSGDHVEINGITFEGATNNYSVQVETTGHPFNFHHNRITGAGSAVGASQNSATLAVIAPNQDIWITDNEFTGDGVTGNTGYIVKTDGAAAGYVQRLHFNRNWIHDNISPDPVYAFDIANSELNDNIIDQGNICGGVLCNNPAGNGVGYALQVYSEGYSLTVNSLTRVSGVVTAVLPVAFSVTWPLQVGDQIMEETAHFGTNGTDFNGVFTVASISVDRKTITWNQTGIPDDTGAGLGPPYGNGVLIPPLQNVTVARNTITNSAGACTYFQGMSNLLVANNNLTRCDLQSQAGGHPQSAIGLNGVWEGSIVGNAIDGVGLTHGIAAQNAYFTTIAGNSIGNIPAGMGINIFDSFHLAVNANTIHDAQTGIGTSTGTDPNCFGCSFSGNTVRMMANGSAYGFGALDSQISISGGAIHAPSTGASNSAIGLGALTSHIAVTGVTINCQPDNATAAAATITYGIRAVAGTSLNSMRGNIITGCNAASGAGINDQGNDDSISNNAITAGLFGILANGGNRQLIVGNSVWGNTTAINSAGSTGAVLLGNQTTQGGTPIYFTFDYTLGTYTFGTNTTTTPEILSLNSAAGHQRIFSFLTAGVARWGMTAESGAESGGNAGSSFCLRAFDDSGSTIDTPICIDRPIGSPVVLARPLTVNSGVNIVYRCNGGTKDGDIVYKTALCTGAGGTATATSLKVD
jgi:Right handed beta helix region